MNKERQDAAWGHRWGKAVGSNLSDWNQTPGGKSSIIPHHSLGLPAPFREEAHISAAYRRGPLHPNIHEGVIHIFSFIYLLTLGDGIQALHMLGKHFAPGMHPSSFLAISLQVDFGLVERHLGPANGVVLPAASLLSRPDLGIPSLPGWACGTRRGQEPHVPSMEATVILFNTKAMSQA